VKHATKFTTTYVKEKTVSLLRYELGSKRKNNDGKSDMAQGGGKVYKDNKWLKGFKK